MPVEKDRGPFNEPALPRIHQAYDPIGNLVKDSLEEIQDIRWTVSGKVKAIARTPGSHKPELHSRATRSDTPP